MSFHEVRFPVNIGRSARGGPQRRTQIVALTSGHEERNASWAASRRRYDVSYGIRRADDLAEVVAFFEARLGRLYGFRFKDWSDYKSCVPSQAVGFADQVLGEGDGEATTFQLRKRYGSPALGIWRPIRKPAEATVRIGINGTEQTSGWSVDLATGKVTFDGAPGADLEVTAGFEFDVPVRFESDLMDVVLDFERVGTIPSIPLVELRLGGGS